VELRAFLLCFEIWWGLLDLIGIDQLYLAIKPKEISRLGLMLGETRDVLIAISGCLKES